MVADEIEPGSSVLDLCCGDCVLEHFLVYKDCAYTGLDSSAAFVRSGRRRRINISYWDGPLMDFPAADVICILSSLYQFMPDEKALVEKMLSKARRKVIITEPVKNMSDSNNPVVRMLARRLTKSANRHTLASIQTLVAGLSGKVEITLPIGREALVVITKPFAGN